MLKKLLAIFISVLIVASCMAVPVMAETGTVIEIPHSSYNAEQSSTGNYGALERGKYRTFTEVVIPEDGNYKVTFNGGAQNSIEMPMYMLVEFGNVRIVGTAQWTGTNKESYTGTSVNNAGWSTKVDNDFGIVSLKAGTYTIKVTNLTYVSTLGFTLKLEKIAEYDNSETYGVYKNFAENDRNSNCGASYGDVNAGAILEWDIELEQDGEYEVYFLGSSQASSESGAGTCSVSVGDKTVTGNKLWTGSNSVNYLGQSITGGNAGWYTVRLNSLGTLQLLKGSKTLKFTNVSGGSSATKSYVTNAVYIKRVGDFDMSNGSITIEKSAWSGKLDTNITTGYAGIGNNGWISYSFDVPVDGEYEVVLYAGTTDGITLDLNFDGLQSIEEEVESTSVGDTLGWDNPVDKSIGSFYLKKGTHTLTITGKSNGSIYVRKVTLSSVGKWVEPVKVSSVTLNERDIIIDFDRDIARTDDNLAKITVTGGYGAKTAAFNDADASQIIVTNARGNVNVNVGAGIKAADGTVLYDDYSEQLYITLFDVSQITIFESGGKYYGQFTVANATGSPAVTCWVVLYDDNDQIVACGARKDYTGIYTGQQATFGSGLLVDDYKGKFSKAKLFIWEKDTYAPVIPAFVKSY